MISLTKLLKSELSFKELFKEIDNYKITVEKQCQTLKAYQNVTTSLSKKELEKMVFQLNYQLSLVYKEVIFKAQHSMLPKRKTIRYCYQNIMHCYIKILIFFYKRSRKISDKLWFEIHSTYMQASDQQVATKSLSKIPQWHSQFKTIKDMYKYCLLLGLIDEYQFCPDEINQIVYALESWAPLLSIHKEEKNEDTYFVDLDKDAPAKRLQKINDYGDSVLFVNIKQIISHINGLLSFQNNIAHNEHSKLFTDSELVLKKSLLERLIDQFSKETTESSSFEKLNETIFIQFGISFNTTSLKIAPSVQEKDAQGKITEYINIDLLPNKEMPTQEVEVKKFQCMLVGINGENVKLLWTGELPSELHPGKIVTIYNDEYSNHIQIGIINSVFIDDAENSYVTIRMFPQNASILTASIPEGSQHAIYHVILISGQSENSSITLVAPIIAFHEGQEINVVGQNREGSLLLGKPIEFYQAHQLFEATFI